jgi:hypothetical protein
MKLLPSLTHLLHSKGVRRRDELVGSCLICHVHEFVSRAWAVPRSLHLSCRPPKKLKPPEAFCRDCSAYCSTSISVICLVAEYRGFAPPDATGLADRQPFLLIIVFVWNCRRVLGKGGSRGQQRYGSRCLMETSGCSSCLNERMTTLVQQELTSAAALPEAA